MFLMYCWNLKKLFRMLDARKPTSMEGTSREEEGGEEGEEEGEEEEEGEVEEEEEEG